MTNNIIFQEDFVTDTLYTDGAFNKHTNGEGWGSVVNKYGDDVLDQYQDLFCDMKSKVENLPVGKRRILISKFNDVSIQQNNGAELLAIIVGLRIAIYTGCVKYIKCDSKLMTDYWSKYLKDDSRKKMDPLKVKYIEELISLRKDFEKLRTPLESSVGTSEKLRTPLESSVGTSEKRHFECEKGEIIKISGNDNIADLGWH